MIADRNPVSYGYDTSGNFIVKLNARYRNCPDTGFSRTVEIEPFPIMDLGPDTVMCPNGEAITIGDYRNERDASARWLWNTGDTTALIQVRHPGIFTTRVMIHGCTTSDSI